MRKVSLTLTRNDVERVGVYDKGKNIKLGGRYAANNNDINALRGKGINAPSGL